MDENLFTPAAGGGVTIVLDVTQSMNEVIEVLQTYLAGYVIRRCATQIDPPITRVSLVTFHDHKWPIRIPHPITAHTVFGTTDNLEEFAYWMHICADPKFRSSGDDHAEAVACGVAAARALDPDASIWLITDDFPHGVGKLTPYNGDSYPDGCPCGTELDLRGVNVLRIYRSRLRYPQYSYAGLYGVNEVVVEEKDLKASLTDQNTPPSRSERHALPHLDLPEPLVVPYGLPASPGG